MRSTTSKQPGVCPFCGSELEKLIVKSPFGGDMTIGFAPCTCEKSQKAEREKQRRIDAEIKAEQEKQFYSRLKTAGVPERYRKAAHEMAKPLAAKVLGGSSVYIWGANGTLKTTLASAIVRELVWRGRKTQMINAVDLLIELQSTYGTPQAEADVIARYSKIPVLVIDDLGKEQQTAWTVSRLYAIVNGRDGEMLPTVVTSNFKLSDLAGRMGACDPSTARAIASRLAGTCEIYGATGHDRRVASGQKNRY
ncbi:ATP-binding protein [Collinsella sp. AGMB00827]|uniref:ATP-binding protein n=1 Tax=Collinsella ureilytica TaxID=2869515 RepID=A0ABS7MLT1_9ACTN|nr:ATP-binding protein [Collinsella urealyticum]MBY4798327.1 ATP-binding protein [Collinsella urealyticum]